MQFLLRCVIYIEEVPLSTEVHYFARHGSDPGGSKSFNETYNSTLLNYRGGSLHNIDAGNTYSVCPDFSNHFLGTCDNPSSLYSNNTPGDYLASLPSGEIGWYIDGYVNESYNILSVSNSQTSADTISFRDIDQDRFIISTSVLKVESSGQNVTNWPNVTISITECGLMYCVNQIHANVTNGTLFETVVELPTKVKSSLANSSSQAKSPFYVNGDESHTFEVLKASTSSISTHIFDMLKQPDYKSSGGSIMFDIAGAVVDALAFPTENNSINFFNQNFEMLYHSPNLTQTFANVSLAMSNNIRENADGLPRVAGTVLTIETTIHVRWQWISLPLGIVVLGAAFVVLTA